MGIKDRVVHLLPVAQLMGHHTADDLRGATINRQLKLRFPLLEQLPRRDFWQRIVIEP